MGTMGLMGPIKPSKTDTDDAKESTMSPDAPSFSGPWPVLDMQERRVLGVLIEKQKTTPEAYPLSVNALVTGSNQKSNRDPILDLEDDDVEEALNRCKTRGLVMKIVGGRVDRWRHLLYDTWHVGKVELAILGELMLRGPQTEGELRTRASRMDPIEDLDSLRRALRPLVERKLVFYLTPEERRGAVLTHGFHDPRELERLRGHFASAAATVTPPTAPIAIATAPAAAGAFRSDEKLQGLEAQLNTMREELAATRQQVSALEKQLAELRASLSANLEELRGLRQALGG
jgi:uncharacterized protein